jgi:hypothetical protein
VSLLNTGAGPSIQGPAPAIDQRIWATDTDRDIKVDFEQLVWKGSDVFGLDVEAGNTVAMQKCDTLYRLLTEISNLATKQHPASESESKI